jgi:hypothetical protein
MPAPYNQIIEDPNHWFEVTLQFLPSDFVTFDIGRDKLFSVTTTHSAFSDGVPQIGCAIAGEVEATFIKPDDEIPKMCPFRILVRARTETLWSVNVFKGIFYIDTREVSHNSDGLDVMKIHGYDAMLKFEQMYPSDDSHDYPLLDTTLLQFMADSVGVVIDQRTLDIMNRGFTFSLPTGYTMREMLGYIASAYGGNFIISDEGRLLLVQLSGLSEETYYLVDENGYAITFGGDRIIV